MPRSRTELTRRQALFVAAYLACGNAAQAAREAGYSVKGAQVTGCKLLTNPKVQGAIAKATDQRLDQYHVTADRVIRELALIGFANMQDYMQATEGGDPYLDFSALTRDQAAALQEVTVERYTEGRGADAREVKRVKFKLGDKKGALVELGKHLGILGDKRQEQAPLIDQTMTQEELRAQAEREIREYFAPMIIEQGPQKHEEPER